MAGNTSSDKALTPEVTWAQRSSDNEPSKNYLYLTIAAADVAPDKMKLDLQPTSLTFSGYSASKKADYHVTLDFYADIDPDESKISHSARDVEMKLQKKELKQEYWPRLLKSSQKMHFLHTNFDKWVDEDEQEGAPDDDYSQFGGAGGGGMPSMGGDGGFGGLDFSKLGGGAGMPDLGDMGGSGAGDEDDEDEDDAMPDLEEDETGKEEGSSSVPAAGTGKKIEEVE